MEMGNVNTVKAQYGTIKLKVIKLLENVIGVFENAHVATSHGPASLQLASSKKAPELM